MKALIAASLLLLLATLAVSAQRVNEAHQAHEEAPTDTYTVEIAIEWQADTMGAMPTDIDIRTEAGTEHFHVLQTSPISVTVSSPPPYEWRAKGLWHLATGGVSETGVISAGLQLSGDAPEYTYNEARCALGPSCYLPGDNRVETVDFSRLQAWYGQPQPCCSPDIFRFLAVDFNGDGLVEVIDFGILASHFGMSGYELP